MQTDSGYLAAAARRCGIVLEEPGTAWDCEVKDNTIVRVQDRSIAPKPGMDGHAVATWFGILCLGVVAAGVLLAIG